MAAAPLDIMAVMLASIIVQAMLFGIYMVLFSKTMSLLLSKHGYRSGKVHILTIVVTVALGVLITAHFILCVARAFNAFIDVAGIPNGGLLYYFDQTNPKYEAVVAMYLTAAVIADAFLIFRLYVIWARNKYIILPVCFTILVTLSVGAVELAYQRKKYSQPFGFILAARPFILTQYFSNVFTNLYCTGLITYKIWASDRAFQMSGATRTSGGHLKRTIRIIIDSALLFTVSTILSATLFVAGTNLQLFFLFITMPIIGISFCLIIVRVAGQVGNTTEVPTSEPSMGPVVYASSGRDTNERSFVDRLKVKIPHMESANSTTASDETEMKFVRPKTFDHESTV